MRNQRVLLVIPTLARGGTQMHLVHLCAGLRQRGWDPHVVCWFDAGPLSAQMEEAGVPLTPLQARSLLDLRALVAFSRLVRRWQPGLVHSYMFGFDLVPFVAARAAGVRALVSSRREIASWMRAYHVALQRAANGIGTHVIACSGAAAEYAAAREKLRPSAVTVILNGVGCPPDDAPSRTKTRGALGIPLEAPTAVLVARFVPVKAHDVFLDGAAQVSARRPDAHFALVGDGDGRRAVERRICELGLDARCHLLGERQDVARLLPAFDVGVLSSHSEGMPNAVLEYMAAGLPVVATAVGGVPEFVDDGVGMLVPPGDPVSLAKALLQLLGEPARAAALGQEARRRAGGPLSLDHMVEEHVRVYEELMAAGGTP